MLAGPQAQSANAHLLQVVIVPIVNKDADRAAVAAAADALVAAAAAAGIRVRLDADTERTPGWKYNHWETKARVCAVHS